MKTILATLGILTFTASTANLTTNGSHTTGPKNSVITSATQQKTQQDTIYIDKDGKQQTTSDHDLANLNSKEIIQIGFYQNDNYQIQAVRMPRIVEKVPTQLPTAITSLKNMFTGATNFNQNLTNWKTTNIIDMSFMFNGAISFNSPIGNWDTTNVKTMFVMFADAPSFNQNLAKWNVANVKHFSLMFYGATAFNQNITNWKTTNATDMNFMFYGAISFQQDLAKWKVNHVTEYDHFATGSLIDHDYDKWPKFKK